MSLRVAPHIQDALAGGRAVVALESTVLTHGLPRPHNLELALDLEADVRRRGAVPATVGVVAGEIVVGLDQAQLERLSAGGAAKASLWNLAPLLARRQDAGTTVATTLFAADAAGIRVFATGGIGGVHHDPGDESADLGALARFGVLTVCSGPKSILDAGATLERLETLGVSVVGYRSERLAGFLVRETPLPLPARAESAAELAGVFAAHRGLGLPSAVVVSNPVSQGMASDEFEAMLATARAEAERSAVRGKDVTPFLLRRLAELSAGRTVQTNLRLLRENAALAAECAVALEQRRQGATHE